MKIELRKYQRDAVNAVWEHLRTRDDNPCVVLPTGGGKAILLAELATQAVKQWDGRVLILAHVKELLEQNAEKVKLLCPDIPVGIYSAGLKSRQTKEPIIVAGIQSVAKKACDLGAFDLIIVDECFVEGTLIETPRGAVPIEDLYVGQPVYTAEGVGDIEAISAKPTNELLKIRLSNGKTIKCTRNHPFFTDKGWTKAEKLERGTCLFSRKDMSCLQQKVLSKDDLQRKKRACVVRGRIQMEEKNILFLQLFYQKYKLKKNNLEKCCKNYNKKLCLLRKDNKTSVFSWKTSIEDYLGEKKILLNKLCKKNGESNVYPCSEGEGLANFERKTKRICYKRWKWKRTNKTTRNIFNYIESSNRISSTDNERAKTKWFSKLLQVRCCFARNKTWNTIRWSKSFITKSKTSRQKNDKMFGSVRVESITRIKLESNTIVYNLQVKGSPTYYANGVLVHNCHLIPVSGDGQYQTFLSDMKIINPNVRIIGLTATPYRLNGGLICKPEIFINHICYEVGVKELINQGYLSPLTCKVTKTEVDLSKLHVRAGEFVTADVAEALDRDEVTRSAVSEIIRATEDRKAVIIFAMTIDHAEHIASCINGYGHECAIVTGDTNEAERKEIVKRIKGEKVMDTFFDEKPPLKYLVNVGVFTTGFDAPNIDCVVLLRATLSPGLYVQMVGRGFRLSPATGKKDCLILDFGENMLRHGPVDAIRIKESNSREKGEKEEDTEKGPKGKYCPKCEAICPINAIRCDDCGYVFPVKIKINAASGGILSGETTFTECNVWDVKYSIHRKRNAEETDPFTLRVDYFTNLYNTKSEWVCPEHSGYARTKFEKWWSKRAKLGCPMPNSVAEAIKFIDLGGLMKPIKIKVKSVSGEKFDSIVDYTMPEELQVMENIPENDYSADEVWSNEYHSNSPADLGVNHDWDANDEIPF